MSGDTVPQLLAWLATYLLHSTVLLGLAWWCTRPARQVAPRTVERVWRLGVLGPLVTATVASLLPNVPLSGVIALRPAAIARVEVEADRIEPGAPTGDARLAPASSASSDLDAVGSGLDAAGLDETDLSAIDSAAGHSALPSTTAPVLAPLLDTPQDPSPDAPDASAAPTSASAPAQLAFLQNGSRAERGEFTRRPPRAAGPRPDAHAATDSDRARSFQPAELRRAQAGRDRSSVSPATSSAPARDERRTRAAAPDPLDSNASGERLRTRSRGLSANGAVEASGETAPAAQLPPAAVGRTSGAGALGGANAARLTELVERLPRLSWSELTFVLWTTPALVLALALLASAIRLGWELRRRREVTDAALLARFDALRRKAGLPRPVRLTMSRTLTGPITYGVLRPEVTLPERALDGLRPEHERSMFAHELAHVVRRDPAWFTFLAALERLLFFQPLLRVARRRLVEVAEERADDLAVGWTGDRVGLASCLAEIARWILDERAQRRALPVAGMASSRLGHRIERLLVPDPPQEPRQRWFAPAACLLLVTTVGAAPRVAASNAEAASGRRTPEAERPPQPAGLGPADLGPADERATPSPQRGPSTPRLPVQLDSPPDSLLVVLVDPDPSAGEPAEDWRAAVHAEFQLLEHEFTLLADELQLLGAELDGDAPCATRAAFETLSSRLEGLQQLREVTEDLLHDALGAPQQP